MSSQNNNFDWRIGYAVFSLIFAAWVVYLSLDNFDKVHGEYRQAKKNLQQKQIEKVTLQELVDQCKAKSKRRSRSRTTSKNKVTVSTDKCLSFPATVLEERKIIITRNAQTEKKRFLRKLSVFYVSFGIFFLALPLYLFYLLLSFLVWVFRDIKIQK